MIYVSVHMGSWIFVCKYGVFVEYGLGFVNLRYIYMRACLKERMFKWLTFLGFIFVFFFLSYCLQDNSDENLRKLRSCV